MEHTTDTLEQTPGPPSKDDEPRRPYTPPTVTSYGSVGELTESGGLGGSSDAMGYDSTTL